MPFLYAGGAQWSIHRKHGLFYWIHNPRSCLLPWFLASALLLLIYVRFNKTSSLIFWKDKYHREFSCMSLFLTLLLDAWKKQIKYVDQWAFFVGGLFCLNSQGSWTQGLFVAAEFTMDKAAKCSLMPIGTIDPFTKMPFMLQCGNCCNMQTDVHETHTRHSFPNNLSHSLSCLCTLEKSYPWCMWCIQFIQLRSCRGHTSSRVAL